MNGVNNKENINSENMSRWSRRRKQHPIVRMKADKPSVLIMFLSYGHTAINKDYFIHVMCVKQMLRIVGKPLVQKIFRSDLIACSRFLATNQTVILPDMASCHFCLFTKLNRTVRGRRFANIVDIKTAC